MNNIISYNDKGKLHGSWVVYWDDGNPWYKCNYLNGKIHGLWQWYHNNGKLESKEFFI